MGSAVSPTYRIGPSDFFSPGDLKADADTLNAQVARVDAQVEGNEALTSDFTDGWTSFVARWQAFYEDHWGGTFSSWLSAVNDSNRDQLIAFETEFQAWAAKAASAGASIVDPIYSPSSGSQDTLGAQLGQQTAGLPSLSSISTTAIVIIILLVAYFFVARAT